MIIPWRGKKASAIGGTGMVHTKGALCLLAAFTLAGTGAVTAKLLLSSIKPFTVTAASLGLAFALLAAVRRGRLVASIRTIGLQQAAMVVLQAVFGIVLYRALLMASLTHTSAAEAGLLTGATPLFTVALARVFLGERLGTRGALGAACTLLGVLLVQGLFSASVGLSAAHLTGNLLALGAALSEAAFNVLSRGAYGKARPTAQADPVTHTALVTLAAFLLCLVPAAWEQPARALAALRPVDWLALGWYGCMVTAVAFVLMYAGIRHAGAVSVAAFSGMMPFTGLALSVWALGEAVAASQWLGGLAVAVGMVLTGAGGARLQAQVAKHSTLEGTGVL
jgi:drug/metabolite transporter (DMT)-like permease